MKANTTILALGLLLAGCANQAMEQRTSSGPASPDTRLSVGTVQREINIGMSATAVVEALGSPNIVSGDGEGRETWVYDRVSTVSRRESESGGAGGLLVALGDTLSGGLLPHYEKSRGERSTTQRTLTVIIKFDEASRVRDFSYHASQF